MKVYLQENLDLDSVHVGDTLILPGKSWVATAKAPKAPRWSAPSLPPTPTSPNIDEGHGPFGGRSVTATVKGQDHLPWTRSGYRQRTVAGSTIKVPGQIAYARYQPLERSTLKAGQKALFAAVQRERSHRRPDHREPLPRDGPGF